MNEPDAYVFSYCSCDLSVGQGMCCSSRAAGPRYAMACARDAHVSWAPILFALTRCVPVWCEGESMWTREAGSAATCIVHESVVSGQLDTGPSGVGPTVRSGHWRMARDRDRASRIQIARIEGSYISWTWSCARGPVRIVGLCDAARATRGRVMAYARLTLIASPRLDIGHHQSHPATMLR